MEPGEVDDGVEAAVVPLVERPRQVRRRRRRAPRRLGRAAGGEVVELEAAGGDGDVEAAIESIEELLKVVGSEANAFRRQLAGLKDLFRDA